jgi:murein L,D-transpeptidase YcbB/YkuD
MNHMRIIVPIVLLALMLPVISSGSGSADFSQGAAGVIRERVTPLPGAKGIVCSGEFLCGSDVLPEFYRNRDYQPAWTRDGRLLPQVGELIRALQASALDGLKPENYHLDRILEAQRKRWTAWPLFPSYAQAADFDMLLTDGFLLFASNLASGLINPETIEAEWFIKSEHGDLAAVLQSALEQNEIGAALDRLRPSHPDYRSLRTVLGKYLEIQARGGWKPVPEGPTLKIGTSGPRVRALQERLAAEGDFGAPAPPDSEIFNEDLAVAVRAFQMCHGLDADGVVGPGVLAALNVPIADRIEQIKANLERWRWLPLSFGPRHILVNIAGFELQVIENGEAALSMEVIVGTHFTQTPVFDGHMSYIEINPRWDVPTKIALEEMLPLIKKDPEYLGKNGFRLLKGWTDTAAEVDPASIDWTAMTAQNFGYRIRQDAGPANSLGRFAFMFPNRFSVYLHDTPAKSLFQLASRSFSHGCIRISRPMDLALYVLRDNPEWTREKIQAAVDAGSNRVISLKKTIPVILIYLTARFDPQRTAQFLPDIYGRDARLERALDDHTTK